MKYTKVSSVVLVCFFVACFETEPIVTVFVPGGPAKSDYAELQIFSTTLPDKPYVEIGEIVTRNRSEETNMEQIRTEARKLGADAVILQYSVGVKTGATSYGIKAVAIRWKK